MDQIPLWTSELERLSRERDTAAHVVGWYVLRGYEIPKDVVESYRKATEQWRAALGV